MLYATADTQTFVDLFDSVSVHIDDVLKGKIAEYDALLVLPYQNPVYSLSVRDAILLQVLVDGMSKKRIKVCLSPIL